MAPYTANVREREERIVVTRSPAAMVHLPVYLAHRAEQGQRLVDEMSAEIQQHPAALGSRGRLAPGLASSPRAPALEPRLVAEHVSEPTLADQATQGELL